MIRPDRARSVAATACFLAMVAAAACGRMDAAARLSPAAPSREAAVRQVLDALAARDQAALEALALTEAEFRARIWPHLPAGRPEVGMPIEYVWGDTAARSRGHLGRLVALHGGRRFTLVRVMSGRATDYGSLTIHSGIRLMLREGERGVMEHRLFGSLVEADEGWKVYSYIVD
jgi:hypothetical protein